MAFPLKAQDRIKGMIENNIQIRQRQNTEQLMKDWLKDVELPEDTIYAILYTPMECTRCENVLVQFPEMLKSLDPNLHTLLITAYPDSALAKNYNDREGYNKADAYLYDTKGDYGRIFTTTGYNLGGYHILKIDRKNGNLLVGGQHDNLDDLMIEQLVAYKGMIEKVDAPAGMRGEDDEYTKIPDSIPPMTRYKDYEMVSDVPTSSVYGTPQFVGDRFFYNDMLRNGVLLFERQADKLALKGVIEVDDTEKDRFVMVSDKDKKDLVEGKFLFYMALTPKMLDEEHIGVSYSIPLVKYESEKRVALYNAPVIISRHVDTLQPDSMISMNVEGGKFFNMHFYYSRYKDQIVVGTAKFTWPYKNEPEEYKGQPDMDSFEQRFYQTDNPIVALVNISDGNVSERYGRLSAPQEVSRTGYFFVSPLSAVYGDELAYSDGFSGNVFIRGEAGEEQVYEAFAFDVSQLPEPDSTKFYTTEYENPYVRFFNRRVSEIKFDKERVHCVVTYFDPKMDDADRKEAYVYSVIDRRTGERREYAVSQRDENVLGCGLRENAGVITPFLFMKKDSGTFIREFQVEDN